MGSLFVVVPLIILGTIVWVVVGVFRQRSGERFTLATALAFYAHLLTVIGFVVVLGGLAAGLKVAISYLNPGYSYYLGGGGGGGPEGPPGKQFGPPANFLDVQREQDIILAAVLLGVGLLVLAGHLFLARAARRMPGGDATWITRGTLIALTAVTGLPGIMSGAMAAYSVLVYFLIKQQATMPFGDPLATAAIFIPAWLVVMAVLLRRLPLRRSSVPALPSSA